MRHFNKSKQELFQEKLDYIRDVLSGMKAYEPYRLTNEQTGIKYCETTRTQVHEGGWDARRHRADFMSVISFAEFEIGIYNYLIGGNIPVIV